MEIVQSFLTNNPCYKSNRKITVKGLMLHSIGCPQPKASVFLNSWNKASYSSACVHGFIDGNTGVVYQTLPWDHRGWHGGGKSNDTHIGIEMCEPACIKYTGGSSFTCSDEEEAKECVEKTYKSAVQLFAFLCNKFNLNPLADGVIVSHKEGYQRGIATNHGDPEHLWNGLDMGYTMNGFRQDVKECMDNGDFNIDIEQKEEISLTVVKKYSPYADGVVNASALNMRAGASTNHAVVALLKNKSKVKVIEKYSNGWLKVQASNKTGYIHGDYIEMIEIKNTSSQNTTSVLLKQGSTGAAVKTLQKNLNTLGADLSVDGIFGPATFSAVVEFQSKNYLDVDGIAGPLTLAKINDNIKNLDAFSDGEIKKFNPYLYGTVNVSKLLNVRSGPGLNYPVIRTLSRGNEVDVMEKHPNGWLKVNIVGTYGYVSGNYIKIKE